MVVETEFLTSDDRWFFNRTLVDQVAFPLGDRYPEEIMTNYFAWYGGLVKKFQPKRVLEIGVRYGYTAIVMWAAALEKGIVGYEYLGVDDESYHAGSCTQANENFRIMGAFNQCRALKWNSITQGLPPNCGTFDVAHVDGNHETYGVLNDLSLVWPIVNVGGVVILDDYYFPEIKSAIHQWLETWVERDEVIAVQFVDDERGHCLIRKTALKKNDTRAFNLTDPLVSAR